MSDENRDITAIWKRLKHQFSLHDYVNDEANILRKEMANNIAAHNYNVDEDVHPNILAKLIKDCSSNEFPLDNLYDGKVWYRKDKKQFYFYNGEKWEHFLTPTIVTESKGTSGILPDPEDSIPGSFMFDVTDQKIYCFTGHRWARMITDDDYKSKIVTVPANRRYIFDEENSIWKVQGIYVLDTDSSSNTYNQYIKDNRIKVSCDSENLINIYNLTSENLQVKIIYIS